MKNVRNNLGTIVTAVVLTGSILLLFTSCDHPEWQPQEELIHYLKDPKNEVVKLVSNEQLTSSLRYQPVDLIKWQFLEGKKDSLASWQEASQYEQYHYFLYRITSMSGKDPLTSNLGASHDLNTSISTLSFRMAEYAKMITMSGDTLPLVDSYFPRYFGHSKTVEMLLVFKANDKESTDEFSVIIDDFGMQTGDQSFNFQPEAIQRIPKLLELKPYYAYEKN